MVSRINPFPIRQIDKAPTKSPTIDNAELLEELLVPQLGQLPSDQASIKGFNFALTYILSGEITTEFQLQALVNPSFDSGGDLYAARGSGKTYFEFTGSRVNVSSSQLDGARLAQDDIPILIKIINERASSIQASNAANAQIKGFNFALTNILSGKITTEFQLKSLVNPSFDSSDDLYAARGSGKTYFEFTGSRVNVSSSQLDGARLAQDDIPILIKIINERASSIQASNAANAQIKGFNFALTNILSGEITTEFQLQALVNPSFDSGGDLYAARGSGKTYFEFTGSRKNVYNFQLDGARLAQDDLQSLNSVLNLLKDSGKNEELKANLKKYLETQDPDSLKRLQRVMSMSTEDETKAKVCQLIDNLTLSINQVQLKQKVYSGIQENQNLNELLKIIADYEGREVSDVQLKADLRDAVIAKNKRDLVQKATTLIKGSLADSGISIASLLNEIEPLLKSQEASAREAGLQLARLAYQLELAELRSNLFSGITTGQFDLLDSTTNQKNIDIDALSRAIQEAPLRASIPALDYTMAVKDIKDTALSIAADLSKFRDYENATQLREAFSETNFDTVVDTINSLPTNTVERLLIKNQLTEFYRSFVAAEKPEDFDARFAKDIDKSEQARLEEKFLAAELGNNKPAWNHIRNRFLATIYPLVESLRANPKTSMLIARYLDSTANDGINPRSQFELRLNLLKKQRELTPIEENYLRSVEILSTLNPYLVACASVSPGETSEFLRQHFNKVSENTLANLQDGDYVPLVQIGLGPDGLAGLGELVRNNPNLARQTLVIDAGEQPGGPFAVPEGPAWELNSANSRGNEGRTMPDLQNGNELKTVRAYGNPATRWYPGERKVGKDTRAGSINTTVDFLPTPDDTSKARYPTNEELQLILSMQTAILTNNIALSTRLIKLEPNPDTDSQGDKIITIEITQANGDKRELKLRTDGLFVSSGLGEDGYGFDLEGSRAQKIIEDTKNETLPKVTKTLEAFRALSSRYNGPEKIIKGDTLVIWGGGNSADTLIENIGNLFKDANKEVQNIKKVYVITQQDLSSRPRYAQINDLKPRNGRGNFIEIVNSKVADVDYASKEENPMDRSLVFLDRAGKAIVDKNGNTIQADYGIAATGFRPNSISEILQAYSDQVGESGVELKRPLKLPTNEEVIVAETLTNDSSVLITGTASKAGFDNLEKLAQLPREAREALLRNGAENAVAIGFRAPDTQAAVNIWINSRDIQIQEKADTNSRQVYVMNEKEQTQKEINLKISLKKPRIPNNVQDERPLLTPLLIYNIGNLVELKDSAGKKVTGNFGFSLTYDKKSDQLKLIPGENTDRLPQTVIEIIKKAAEDESFQNYALLSLRAKRSEISSLNLNIAYFNGYLNPKLSYVDA